MANNKLPTDIPVQLSSNQVRSVAIIGGGASGSIVLDSLVQEDHIKSITLFERRQEFGGIWNFDPEVKKTPHDIIKPGFTHDKTDPQLQNPFNSHLSDKKRFIFQKRSTQERFEETPSYKGIKTNVIQDVMTFSDLDKWEVPGITDPEKTVYVEGLVVRDYIDKYIQRNTGNEKVSVIKGTSVEDVERIHREDAQEGEIDYQFKLTLRQPVNEEHEVWWQEVYDSVVVATGHYFVPYIPFVKGLETVQKLAPEIVHHAKYYRDRAHYKGDSVVVVGSRASGADLSKYLADSANNVYHSIRTLANTRVRTKKSNVTQKPLIKEFKILSKEGEKLNFKVIFEDDSEVSNPDHIVYATGYQFSFPFLNRLLAENGRDVTKEGALIQNLYQHTFLIDEPLISFVGMPIDGISFRVFEYQAVLVARYLAGKIALPTRADQKKWYADRLDFKGLTRGFHTLGLEAPEYLKGLTELGYVDTTKVAVGRPFPVLTEENIRRVKEFGQKLVDNWDDR